MYIIINVNLVLFYVLCIKQASFNADSLFPRHTHIVHVLRLWNGNQYADNAFFQTTFASLNQIIIAKTICYCSTSIPKYNLMGQIKCGCG